MKRWIVRISKSLGALVLLAGALFLFNYLRHIVFWSPTEAVEFTSADGTVLRGQLVSPPGPGTHPAVVMLHGSGAEGMDEPSYHIVTNAIVRSGVAVLLYDKRGVGNSDGDFSKAQYGDFIEDGIAAVRYLATRDDIDHTRIGLHGNSESGWFTPEIAYRSGAVAFIFNRAGPPLPWRENVIWEVRNDLLAAGVAEGDLPSLIDVVQRRWQYYIDVAADPSLASGPERDAINAELKRLVAEIPGAEGQIPREMASYDAKAYADIAAQVGYDPQPFLELIDTPIVYTFASEDINVPTARSVAWLETFRMEYDKDIRIVVFDGVGHAMANLTGIFNAGYIPEYMDLLYEFYGDKVR